MKHTMKRALALLLCLVLAVTLLPAGSARAEEIDVIPVGEEPGDDEIVIVDVDGEPVLPAEPGDGDAEPYAGGNSFGFDGLYVEPLYRSVITEEQLAEKLRSAAASADLLSVGNSVKYCSTLSAAGIYLRAQMVKRSSSVTFLIPEEMMWEYDDVADTIYKRAIIHSESRTPQEGDSLRWGSIGRGYGYSYSYSDEYGPCYEMTFDFVWTTTAAQENTLTTRVNSAISSLNLDGKTEKQKIRAIHDYICDNVNYDYEHVDQGADYPLQFSAYAALCQGKAVCQGYAILFYRLAKEAGLDVRVVTSANHAWNIVRVGSVYYNIDTTWDGQDDATYTTWYLKGMRDFEHYNHLREGDFCSDEFWNAYPMVKDPNLNLDNPVYGFVTTAGTTLKSTATNGTPRLLIFNSCSSDSEGYGYDSGATLMRSFFDYKLDGVKVIVLDTNYNSKATLKLYREQLGGGGASFCYDTDSGYWEAFSGYNSLCQGQYINIAPTFVFIDGNNKVQDFRTGDYGPETLAKLIKTYQGVTLSYGAPRITVQPKSVTVSEGWAGFSVQALGHGDLSYQWYYRTSASGSWKKCSGYSSSSYFDVEALKYRDGYQYRCKVSNDCGSVYTDPATLSVKLLPTITSQPQSMLKTIGYTAKFTVKAENAVKYQWYYRTSESGSWAKSTLTGATTATLSVVAKSSRDGYQYRCRVYSSDGSVYSEAASLSVTPKPVITEQPQHQTAPAGETVKFTVKASGAKTYQWYYRTSASGSWVKSTLSGATTATLSVESKSSRNGYQYRCKLSNSNANSTVYTDAVSLTVGTVKYRALLVAEVSFYWDNATRNRGDVTNMANMLASVQGPKGGYYNVTCKQDLGREALQEAISTTFAGADSDDVSLFFIATHGVVDVASGPYAGELCLVDPNGYEEFFLLEELRDCLKAVPGKVIVLLGSCGSGAAIIENGSVRFADDPSGASDEAFNEAVIRIFAEADEELAANTGEFRSSKFYVMTAAAHQESSWGYEFGSGQDGYNLFPLYFAEGASGDKPADADGNGTVTMIEMFNYVYTRCYEAGPFYEDGENVYQHVQMYPANSTYALFK